MRLSDRKKTSAMFSSKGFGGQGTCDRDSANASPLLASWDRWIVRRWG
jgi:hypothetical protein